MSDTTLIPGDDDIVVVTIEPDAEAALLGKKADGEVRKHDGSADPLDDLKGQFANMQTTLATTSQQLVQTQQEKDEALRVAAAAQTELVETRKGSIDQGIAAAKADADAAESDYERAMNDGDFKAAARAQRRMASAEATIQRLDGAKEDIEVVKPAGKPATERRAAPQQVDQVESYISKFTPQSQAWLRNHRDYASDSTKNAKLITAHHVAVDAGLTPDSPEYFEAIETKLGLRQDTGKQQQQTQRRPIAPTGPVGHSGGGMNGNAPNEVKLTLKEATAADDGTHTWQYDDPTGKGRFKKGDPIGRQEFARRKMIMQREGRYDRTMTE